MKKPKIILALPALALVLGLVFVNPPAHAASTYYVDASSGSDANPCSQTQPCETIQAGIDASSNGDTVIVAPGTYQETPIIDKPLTLKGAQSGNDARSRSGAETIVNTPVSGSHSGIIVQSNNVTIDGFTIDGSTSPSPDKMGIYAVGLSGANRENLHIYNNIIKNNHIGVDAIYNDIDGVRISHNLFDSNTAGSNGSDGIYFSNSTSANNVLISENAFKNTNGDAINMYAKSGMPISNLQILNNTSNSDNGFVWLAGAKNVTIAGNTAQNDSKYNVVLGLNLDSMTIKNNTFKEGVTGVNFYGALPSGGSPAKNVTITGNTISGMSTAAFALASGSVGSGIKITTNTVENNAAKIQNNSGVEIIASNNNADPNATNDSGNTPSGVKAPSSIDTGEGGFAARHSVFPLAAGIVGLTLAVVAITNRSKLAFAFRKITK